MAKPIGNGKSMEMNGKSNAALDRSWLVNWDDETQFINQAYDRTLIDPVIPEPVTDDYATDKNDFFYIDTSFGLEGVYGDGEALPDIDGLGGADQIIMMEEAIIGDTFFTNMENVTVLKLWDGNDAEDEYEFTGSQVTLAEEAQEAGIREVTGGPGDDVIDFSGYVIEEDDNEEPVPLDIIIRGGAGADEMTASVGNDTFIWGAGDMEDTDADNFDTINGFNVEDDTLDIAKLLAAFVDDGYANVEYSIEDDDTDTTLYIDLDGADSQYESEELVVLQGVSDSSQVDVIYEIV